MKKIIWIHVCIKPIVGDITVHLAYIWFVHCDLIGMIWLVHWHNGAYLSSHSMCHMPVTSMSRLKTGTEHYRSCTIHCTCGATFDGLVLWSAWWHDTLQIIDHRLHDTTQARHSNKSASAYVTPSLVGCITYCMYVRTYVGTNNCLGSAFQRSTLEDVTNLTFTRVVCL